MRYLGFVLDVSKTIKVESVSVNNEDTKSGSINFQDDNLPENEEATSVNTDLSKEITNTGCKEDNHLEIARENFDAVAGTMSSCYGTPQNTNDAW